MEYIGIILSPIIWAMQLILEGYIWLFSSVGFSILLLSLTMFLILSPIRVKAQKIELRMSEKIARTEKDLVDVKAKLKGEKLFLATEKVYKKHKYHPIQSVLLGSSFVVMLPVLLSAIFLFTGDVVQGKSFLLITDLSEPDGLIAGINMIPILMTGITFLEANLRFKDDKRSRNRFYIIGAALFILVYSLPSGMVLYWMGSNFFSLANFLISRFSSN